MKHGIDDWIDSILMSTHRARGRRLNVIAEWVNSNPLGIVAFTRPTVFSTDIIRSGIRYPRKGRKGTLIEFRSNIDGSLLFSHNSGQTYAYNQQVERWLAEYIKSLPSNIRSGINAPAFPSDTKVRK